MINTLEENIKGLRDFIKDEDVYQFYKGVIEEYSDEHARKALKNASENAKMEELDVERDNIDLVDFGHYSFSGDESRVEVSIHKPSILSESNLPKHK